MKSFVEVCRLGSFSRAAATRGLTQPGVTRHVQRLEHELGATLFERERSGAAMTAAGQRLLAYAVDAIERHDTVLADLATTTEAEIRGTLRIAASTTPGESLLPPLLSGFTELYPQVRP